MNVSGTSNVINNAIKSATNSTSSVESKRAQLQKMLLMKAFESQQVETTQEVNQATGKGQVLDIRI